MAEQNLMRFLVEKKSRIRYSKDLSPNPSSRNRGFTTGRGKTCLSAETLVKVENCQSSGFRFPPSLKLWRAGGIFGQTLAAAGGEMRPNYFKNSPPNGKLQARGNRLASLGDQIVRNSGRKNQLAILLLGKENF